MTVIMASYKQDVLAAAQYQLLHAGNMIGELG